MSSLVQERIDSGALVDGSQRLCSLVFCDRTRDKISICDKAVGDNAEQVQNLHQSH